MPDNPLFGTSDPELLQIGDGSGVDTIYGGEGRDTIFGHAGDDSLVGDGGNDRMWGGDGNDRVDGLDGNDRLYGGRGNDYFDAGWGNDTVYGGAGNDGISTGYGADLIYGGDGDDGISSSDLIPLGVDTIYGGAGNDNASFLGWSTGHFDGGEGTDILALYWNSPGADFWARVHVDMTEGNHIAQSYSSVTGEVIRGVTFEGVEALRIQTGFGSDTVIGAGGDDEIFVGVGANLVDAGGGDDRVHYHTGDANTLAGGDGTDTLVVGTLSNLRLQFDGGGAVATDGHGSVLTGFERFEVQGSAYEDTAVMGGGDDDFRGERGSDTTEGGAGNDRLFGGREGDLLQGGEGDDRIVGGLHNDTLQGDGGNDRLGGGRDADTLFGGDGRDRLNGGSGIDLLWGGADGDDFRFTDTPEPQADVIGDFTSGEDRLLFAATILNGTPGAGRMTAADLSFGAAVGTTGQFLYVTGEGTDGALLWDADGSGAAAAQLLVLLSGAPALAGNDIWIA